MASYHLWHPAYVGGEPLTLEAFVTQGDALLPPTGTQALTEAVLETLAVSEAPRTHALDAIRTHYFSSHRGATGDWRDDWDLAWRLRVTLVSARAPALPDPPGWGYYDLDTGGGDPAGEDGPWPCLLLADAPETATLEAAREAVRHRHPDAGFTWGRAFGRHPQLRCDLGERSRDFYADGAREAEAALGEIAAAGATVRFDAAR